MSLPLVCVVTPVYNREKYIAEAIESVLAQTYSNWEYVIVENCSTDRTLEIVQKYASKDTRIRLIENKSFLQHTENMSHSMRQVSPDSKYCKVIHSDDVLLPHCLEKLVNLGERYPTAGVISSYRIRGNEVRNDGIPYDVNFMSGRELCRKSLIEPYFYVIGNPSTLLLRTEIVLKYDPFYDHLFLTDTESIYEIMKETDFGFVHQILTFTRLHDESATSSVERFGINWITNLAVLIQFGEYYLSQEEYGACIKKRLYDYYRYLGVSLLQMREREFWNYQVQCLGRMGLSLNRSKVFIFALGVMLTNITHPERIRQTFRGILKREKPKPVYRL